MSRKLEENIKETGNVVEEYMLGDVEIRIFDSSYINRSKEDIERTIKNLNRIATRIIRNQQV